ncbi:MAG: hypothetical protein IJB74_05840 [Clostridia bacterium]|nr:hypothetical protein [Clostridia bacterium]
MGLKDGIILHIDFLDKMLFYEEITGKSLKKWMVPLLNSFGDEGELAYLLETEKRYRASPLASTIEWMSDAGLLSIDSLLILQNQLVSLRDKNIVNDVDSGNNSKETEDKYGWSLAEGVSVWSTSVALIALINNKKSVITHKDVIKESTLWLCEQRNIKFDGWAYQNIDNCNVNVVCTSLALRALAKAMQYHIDLNYSQSDIDKIVSSLNSGYAYLKNNIIYNKNKMHYYWNFIDKPHVASTTWALLALREIEKISNTKIKQEFKTFYYEIKDKSLDFVISTMPSDIKKWNDEQIVCEAGAKYAKQKNYYSFTATLLPQLFSLGVSPYHPKVIKQIKWIVENPNNWIGSYDNTKPSSFTYAMLLSTLTQWVCLVGKNNALYLLKKDSSIVDKINSILFGFSSKKNTPEQIVLKSRIKMSVLLMLLLVVSVFFGKPTYTFIVNKVECLFSLFIESYSSILVNIVSSFLYAGIIAIGASIIKFFRRISR